MDCFELLEPPIGSFAFAGWVSDLGAAGRILGGTIERGYHGWSLAAPQKLGAIERVEQDIVPGGDLRLEYLQRAAHTAGAGLGKQSDQVDNVSPGQRAVLQLGRSPLQQW